MRVLPLMPRLPWRVCLFTICFNGLWPVGVMTFFSRAFIPLSLLTACLLGAVPARALDAQDLPPCAPDAYTGKERQSHNGSAADLDWYRRVRAEATPQGCLRYVLRAAPRAGLFDSIRPVPLGGFAVGFEAAQGNQRRLFSPHGQDLLGEAYGQPVRVAWPALPDGAWQYGRYAGRGQPPAALTLALADDSRGTVFLRVQQGRVIARSARLTTAGGELARRFAVPAASGLQAVTNAQGDTRSATGLLELATLREIVPLRYADAGALPESGQPQKIRLLMARRPPGKTGETSESDASGAIDFFLPDGRPAALLPDGQTAHTVQDAPGPDGQRRYLALQDRVSGTCHYLAPTLQTLLTGGVPATADKPCPALREGQPLRFTDAAGRTHRYSYTPQNGLTALGAPLPGTLQAQSANHFMLLMANEAEETGDTARPGLQASASKAQDKTPEAQGETPAAPDSNESPEPPAPRRAPRYMAYDDTGTPIPDAVGFDDFEDQGCGAWRVLRDGQWRHFTEGGLLPDRQPPAGCAP